MYNSQNAAITVARRISMAGPSRWGNTPSQIDMHMYCPQYLLLFEKSKDTTILLKGPVFC